MRADKIRPYFLRPAADVLFLQRFCFADTSSCCMMDLKNDRNEKEFGLTGDFVHIINGHVPVERIAGENPVKCNGKLILIDGGFSKTYRRKTGIAGYTLTYNSYGLTLSAHEPFDWSNEAVRDELDIVSHQEAVEYRDKRILVGDTDVGKRMMIRIEELKKLIQAYQDGEIAERDASSAYKW